jgi:uncharacterized protein
MRQSRNHWRPVVLAGIALIASLCLCTAAAVRAESRLADAAEKQDREAILAALDDAVDVNAVQADGMSALHWAVHFDDLETSKRLIASGADVNRKTRYEVTPLSIACLDGNSSIVETLLEAGADPNTALRGGETALMTAARTGKPELVRVLIARGAYVNAKEKSGQTALMWAAAEGHADVAQMLIDAGADINARVKSGFTPLLFAAREGRTEAVRVLLKAGVDVNLPMKCETQFARSPRDGTTPLIMAVESGQFDMAIELVKAGADPNSQGGGFSALHVLTWVRKPNRGDGEDGDPPPMGSGQMTSLEFVRKIVELGADVNARLERGKSRGGRVSDKGATPLLMAAGTADVPYLRLLVELGADPKISNVEDSTPLHAAAGVGIPAPFEEAGTEPEVVDAVGFLLDQGLDIDAVDGNGETAMHGAAYRNFPLVVHLLADRGANPEIWNQKNKRGWTPLLIAQGFRPGNFRPSRDTMAAFEKVMRERGLEIPPPPQSNEPSEEYRSAPPKRHP